MASEQNLLIDIRAGRTALAAMQRIGHAVHARRDRIFSNFVIRRAGERSSTHTSEYIIKIHTRSPYPSKPPKPPKPPKSAVF